MDRGQWSGSVSPEVHGQLQKWTVAILTLMRNRSPPTTRHGISKRTMCRPTRLPYRGRLIRLGEMSEEDTQPLHRGIGGSMYTRKAQATREAPMRDQG